MHDWEPGIAGSGLFWTVPVSPSAITINPNNGTARLRVTNMAIPDFHDFINAISTAPPTVPSHVSFDVRWAGGGDRSAIRDDTYGYEGVFITGNATIDFVASNDGGLTYRSDHNVQTNVGSPGVGRERNGAFFT